MGGGGGVDGDAARVGGVDLEEVEERVGGVGVVAGEGEERVLTVEEEDGVGGGEEVFGRGRTAGT